MKKVISFILCLSAITASGQSYRQYNFEETVHGLSTIVNVLKGNKSQYFYSTFGTGFFYHQYTSSTLRFGKANSIDTSLKNIWLITNKHVLFGTANRKLLKPTFPAAIEFYIRKKVKNADAPKWDTIRVDKVSLEGITKLHGDSLIDVVAINVTKFLLPKLSKGDSLYYYGAVSSENFPNPDIPINITGRGVSVGEEILSIGYPRNFYDTVNLFPTVKSGVIASKWKAKYNGNPYFLIDAKLFPGSSGSIIISKPGPYGVDGNSYEYFQFLGIFSGEPYTIQKPIEFDDMTIIRKETYNIGIVWYYYLIEEIINEKSK